MGERRLTGVLSTPTMSLRLQVPMLSGTRTMASTLGIQQMLMPACVMLVRNQIEWHNSPLLTVTIGSVVPRGTCTARRCAFPEWLEVASGDAWCLMSKLVSCNVQRNFSRTCLNIVDLCLVSYRPCTKGSCTAASRKNLSRRSCTRLLQRSFTKGTCGIQFGILATLFGVSCRDTLGGAPSI